MIPDHALDETARYLVKKRPNEKTFAPVVTLVSTPLNDTLRRRLPPLQTM
jgi:hypothetical protein